jgi:pyrimidine-nucleoside phosphorylase
LTDVLLTSGVTLDLSRLPGPTVDKHSTGGVGDGTTLLVAPLLAAAGAQVVKLSGRGLGHTGGTLDKLEAIPGFRTALGTDELLRIAADVGCVVAAQTDELVPADRALYALRDETGTVASRALIASSVMSKKLAAGAGTIVLDVKAGNGAFLDSPDAAQGLARLCVDSATAAGRRCVALVTAMDTPLGHGIGNALEVA